MTEKKRLHEQMALHTYKRQGEAGTIYSVRQQSVLKGIDRSNMHEAPHTLQRVVTIPEADPSVAWNTFAQRQEERRRARARPQKYTEAAPRTFAQTGLWASSGRMKTVHRSVPLYPISPVPTRSGRLAERRSFFWKLLSVLAGGILLIIATNFAFASNAFRIEQVTVVGTHNDGLIHTIQRMGMQGQNIFLINVAALTEHIEEFPQVLSVSLSKQWPNQLTVTVVERTPVLLWQTAQGTYSVDQQGVVIAPVDETTRTDHLKTVFDLSRRNKGNPSAQAIHPGIRLNQADIAFARDVFDRLPKLAGITAFKLRYDGTMYANSAGRTGDRGYSIESPDGWIAYLGDANDANPLDNRLLELQQILAMAQKQQLDITSIDLRYGLRPIYTLKQ